MMIEEFEARTNFTVTPNEYSKIEQKYTSKAFGHCDKDEFCRLWVEGGGIKEILQARKDGNVDIAAIKRYSSTELMELTVEIVKKAGEYEKAEAILDYFLPEDFMATRLTNYEFNFIAVADFGGSEGIYLDCWLRGKFDDSGNDRRDMGTFKTLKDDLESMKIMAELGGILNYYQSEFVNKNIKSFMPDDILKNQLMYEAGLQLDAYLLQEQYQELLEKGKSGNLSAEENEALQAQIRDIEKMLPRPAVQEAVNSAELEQGEEI